MRTEHYEYLKKTINWVLEDDIYAVNNNVILHVYAVEIPNDHAEFTKVRCYVHDVHGILIFNEDHSPKRHDLYLDTLLACYTLSNIKQTRTRYNRASRRQNKRMLSKLID